MSDNLKVLGVALGVALAFSVLTAPIASAVDAHLKADTNGAQARFHIEQDGEGSTATQVFLLPTWGELHCNLVTGEGFDADGTAASLTVDNLEYDGTSGSCELLGLQIQTNLGSCDYTFHVGAYLGGGEATGSTDIECEGSDVISFAGPGCTLTWAEQTGIGDITYHQVNAAIDYVTAELSLVNIKYIGHGIFCGPTTLQNDGYYQGNINFTAFDSNGNPVDGTIVEKS